MLYAERGGTGPRSVLLLHGLGATAAVWAGVCRELGERELGRWAAVDLSGHGGSPWSDFYSTGGLAAVLAPLVRDAGAPPWIIGHSLGAYVGLALASGWFGVQVAGVLGVGPKVSWTAADLQLMQELAARPVRHFADRAEALARYRKASGLDERIAPGEESLARGIAAAPQGWHLAADPRTFLVAGTPFDSLVRSARCPVLLARGEHDAMVSLAELRRHQPEACELPGLGHNAHVERPSAIVALLEQLLTRG